MKATISSLLLPCLKPQTDLDRQLGLELLLIELQSELARAADKRARSYMSSNGPLEATPPVKAMAHRLEDLVLRHDNTDGWEEYLKHEEQRKSGQVEELVTDIRSWLQFSAKSPVTKAIAEARKRAVLRYGSEAYFPLNDDWPSIEQSLKVPALREFLALLLEELTR